MSINDRELIKGCLREKPAYQKELFRRYSGKLLAVSTRYARNRAEAEDILQDAFIKIFNKMATFKNEGSFEGWMKRIVVHTALKNYSKHQFKKEISGLDNLEDPFVEPSVWTRMNVEEVMKKIAELPDGYRLVFNLNIIEGYSHAEIATMLNIGESTSRSQLAKARKMLQKKFIKMDEVVLHPS